MIALNWGECKGNPRDVFGYLPQSLHGFIERLLWEYLEYIAAQRPWKGRAKKEGEALLEMLSLPGGKKKQISKPPEEQPEVGIARRQCSMIRKCFVR